MRMYDLIVKKKRGGEMSREELDYIVGEFTADRLPKEQMAAFLMAVWFRGMTDQETTDLTLAMLGTGTQADLSAIPGIKVDKHSTGGVGDKTTLVVAPLVAACGGVVAKMSGRGLGHTGGTIDKLESIPGFRAALSEAEFFDVVKRCGLAVIGQSAALAPADGGSGSHGSRRKELRGSNRSGGLSPSCSRGLLTKLGRRRRPHRSELRWSGLSLQLEVA